MYQIAHPEHQQHQHPDLDGSFKVDSAAVSSLSALAGASLTGCHHGPGEAAAEPGALVALCLPRPAAAWAAVGVIRLTPGAARIACLLNVSVPLQQQEHSLPQHCQGLNRTIPAPQPACC